MNAFQNAVRRPGAFLRAWVLAAAILLAAQTAGLVHDLDPRNAPPDHVCEMCLLGANLDHAAVGSPPHLDVQPQADRPFAAIFVPAAAQRVCRPPARGPPLYS